MRRRELIMRRGGAAAWPLAVRAQQPAMPVIGYLSPGSLESDAFRLSAFRQGLNETGYVEGQNVAIEYRGAQGQYDRLSALAADLVRRQVTVLCAPFTPSVFVAKAATTTIPIVFTTGVDPVASGLVASLKRPGGNVTGVTLLNVEVMAKRLELLRELVPTAAIIALLVNPASDLTESETRAAGDAAQNLGVKLNVLNATNESEIDESGPTAAPCDKHRFVLHQPARSACGARSPPRGARDLCISPIRLGRRAAELRNECGRLPSPSRRLRRPHSQG